MSEMIAAIQALAALLAQDPLTVDDIGARLGSVVKSGSGNVIVAPRDPLFTEANIVRGLSETGLSQIPSHIDLTPAKAQPAASFEEAFGTPREIPSEDKGVPPKLIFRLPMEGQPYGVTLITPVVNDEVVGITLRRDKRL